MLSLFRNSVHHENCTSVVTKIVLGTESFGAVLGITAEIQGAEFRTMKNEEAAWTLVNKSMVHCVANQVGGGFQLQFLKNPASVRSNRMHT